MKNFNAQIRHSSIKVILVLSLLLLNINASAGLKRANKLWNRGKGNYEFEIAKELMSAKLYYASLPFMIKFIHSKKKISKRLESYLEKLLVKTSAESFLGIDVSILREHPESSTLNFILGLKYFKKKQYTLAISTLKKVQRHSKVFPEAILVTSSSYNLLNKFEKAEKYYKICSKYAKNFYNSSRHKKLKRYYGIIKDNCIIHEARLIYKSKNYQKAIDTYNKVSKTSYQWPFLLLEKAWAYYYLGNYNRTLGLLVTYKSPLLQSYFNAEGELLSAMAYLKLCQYDDAMLVFKQFNSVFNRRGKKLKRMLLKHKKSNTFFLKLAFSNISANEKRNPFVRNIITLTRKKVKFNIDVLAYERAKKEYRFFKKILKSYKTNFNKLLLKEIGSAVGWRTRRLNHFVKKNMFSFTNTIYKFSYEMFNIKLEIISKKRNSLYKRKIVKKGGRKRGSLANVTRTVNQQFWDFKGSFWADELGDYSFGLPSLCKIKKDTI